MTAARLSMDGCCIAAILAKAQGPWEQSCDDYSEEAAHLAAHVEVCPVPAVPALPCNTCQERASHDPLEPQRLTFVTYTTTFTVCGFATYLRGTPVDSSFVLPVEYPVENSFT